MGRHNKAFKELRAQKAKAREEEEAKAKAKAREEEEAKAKAKAREEEAKTKAREEEAAKTKAREEEEAKAKAEHLINETVKESGWDNEAMRTKETPNGWAPFVGGVDELKSVETSSTVRLQSSQLDSRQKSRVEVLNSVEIRVYSAGNSAQTHSDRTGDFRKAGNGRGGDRGGYWHQAPEVDALKSVETSSTVRLQPSQLDSRQKSRVEGLNSVENRVYSAGHSAQSHSDRTGDFRKVGNGRGGDRGGYGHQAPEVDEFTRIESLGRLLSSVLRHRAVELRLNMRSDGYVLVQDLLKLRLRTYAGLPLSSHTVDDIKEAVRMDNKQRFGLREENGQLLIRANQGHSIQTIKSEDLLSCVYSAEEVPVCVHGTYLDYLSAIQKEGLKRMNRLHVHFATGLSKDKGVISGMRSTSEVLIHLDVQKYLKDGMKLYRSENGVILAEGINGVIPPDYFAKIERVKR